MWETLKESSLWIEYNDKIRDIDQKKYDLIKNDVSAWLK